MEKREDENQIAPKFIKRKTQPHNKIRDKTTISNLNYSAIHIRSKTKSNHKTHLPMLDTTFSTNQNISQEMSFAEKKNL